MVTVPSAKEQLARLIQKGPRRLEALPHGQAPADPRTAVAARQLDPDDRWQRRSVCLALRAFTIIATVRGPPPGTAAARLALAALGVVFGCPATVIGARGEP
jgi:hypothetical protein